MTVSALRVRACAHRGDSSLLRENTLPAIRSAIAKGADVVEIDVRLTADGDVVVLHDPTLERLWGDDRAIAHVSTVELEAFGDLDRRPPLLTDVLPLFAGSTSRLVVDLDDQRFAAPAHAVVSAFTADTGTTVDWCGDLGGMRVLRALDPTARIWMPWSRLRVPTADEVAELAPVTVNAPFCVVDDRLVRGVHDLGLTVTAWTLDETAELTRARALGVDTITTNRLDRLLSLLSGAAR